MVINRQSCPDSDCNIYKYHDRINHLHCTRQIITVRQITDCIYKSKSRYQWHDSACYNSFHPQISKCRPGLVRQYEKEADKLATVLASDRQEQNARADRFSAGTAATLEEEIQEYEAYIAEDGKRRQEIRDLDLSSAEQIQRLEALIELSYEVEREIEEWEDDDDEDGDGGEPDYESLWRPVRNGLEGLVIPVLSFALYQEGLLGLLVPDGH